MSIVGNDDKNPPPSDFTLDLIQEYTKGKGKSKLQNDEIDLEYASWVGEKKGLKREVVNKEEWYRIPYKFSFSFFSYFDG